MDGRIMSSCSLVMRNSLRKFEHLSFIITEKMIVFLHKKYLIKQCNLSIVRTRVLEISHGIFINLHLMNLLFYNHTDRRLPNHK